MKARFIKTNDGQLGLMVEFYDAAKEHAAKTLFSPDAELRLVGHDNDFGFIIAPVDADLTNIYGYGCPEEDAEPVTNECCVEPNPVPWDADGCPGCDCDCPDGAAAQSPVDPAEEFASRLFVGVFGTDNTEEIAKRIINVFEGFNG